MIKQTVGILLLIVAGCSCCIAATPDKILPLCDDIPADSIKGGASSVVRELWERCNIEVITFIDDTKSIININRGIKYHELLKYMTSQKDNLDKMSIKILDIFPSEILSFFNESQSSPIRFELIVSREGQILKVKFFIPGRVSSKITDQQLLDMRRIILGTRLDAIPQATDAVRFNSSVPRVLLSGLLDSER